MYMGMRGFWHQLMMVVFDATIVYVEDLLLRSIGKDVWNIVYPSPFAGTKPCDYIETIEGNCSFYSIKSKKITHQKVIRFINMGH
jgi:hypothetical protein